MTALPLEPHTEAEEATLARFEGAEPAPESWHPDADEIPLPPECDWGWCRGEAVAYRDDLAGTDDSDPLPVCQLHLDHRPDVQTRTCREDGSPWPCDVERRARRTLAERQAEEAHDPTKRYPECMTDRSAR